MPRLVLLGRTAEGDAYSIQEALPGRPPRRRGLLRPSQVQRIAELNDLQADRAVSTDQDWSTYVAGVVFEDISDWWGSLRDYSAETAGVADALERLVRGKTASARRADIVHGDFSPGNILTLRGEICGVVDWDAAGCGDRAFDLALLLFYHYADPTVREPLVCRVLDLAGFDALCVYLAYTILGQAHWSIHHHDRSAVAYWLGLARPILDDLQAGARPLD